MRRFKAETGMRVGDYITKCKLEEACDLLVYGERTLAEISAYLGYSSQSYFQNVRGDMRRFHATGSVSSRDSQKDSL